MRIAVVELGGVEADGRQQFGYLGIERSRVASPWRSRTFARVVSTRIRGLSDDAGSWKIG